jgi:ABC-type dipeptide/oligopeptide/nickel transport system permease component
MGYLVLISVLVVLFNLVADLAYGWLDPRVKYD